MRLKIILLIVVLIALISGVSYFLFFTSPGNKFLITKALNYSSTSQEAGFESLDGILSRGATFKNIEIKNVKDLPEGTVLRVQQLFVKVKPWNLKNSHVEIEHARLKLPDSDPIVVSGNMMNEIFDINIFSTGFTVNEVLSYLPDFKKIVPVQGEVTGIDLYIKGNVDEPHVNGDLTLKRFVYQGFALMESPVRIDVQLKDPQKNVQVFGNVYIDGGELYTQKALIKITKGKINFSGPYDDPEFNLTAHSRVERTKIDIALRGTVDDPQLNLSSDPPLASEKLMVMLATGKSWKSVESSLDSGELSSTDLAKDFIDYFFFAGKTNKFAEKLGIYDFSVKFEKNTRGVEARKIVTENLDVGYGIEQKVGDDQSKTVSQKIQGEYQVTDKLSVGVERELKQTDLLNDINSTDEQTQSDKVYMKYKKSF